MSRCPSAHGVLNGEAQHILPRDGPRRLEPIFQGANAQILDEIRIQRWKPGCKGLKGSATAMAAAGRRHARAGRLAARSQAQSAQKREGGASLPHGRVRQGRATIGGGVVPLTARARPEGASSTATPAQEVGRCLEGQVQSQRVGACWKFATVTACSLRTAGIRNEGEAAAHRTTWPFRRRQDLRIRGRCRRRREPLVRCDVTTTAGRAGIPKSCAAGGTLTERERPTCRLDWCFLCAVGT